VRSIEDLGEYFGAELYAREVDYMIEHEWAQTADDILYRRTKAGLVTSPSQQQALGRYIAMRLAAQ
jgi:glycerol-3-phosphate dehydrogenase